MSARAPAPVKAPASAVPADYGLYSDQDEMPPPSRVEPSNDQPEESMRARAEGDLELVAQEQVFDHEVAALMEEGGQGREEDAE